MVVNGEMRLIDPHDWTPMCMLSGLVMYLHAAFWEPCVSEETEGCFDPLTEAAWIDRMKFYRTHREQFEAAAWASMEQYRGPLWSHAVHCKLAYAKQRQQVPWLLWLVRQLAAFWCSTEEGAFTDVWVELAMPTLLGRTPIRLESAI